MVKDTNLPAIQPLEIEFQGVKLSCPLENGHRMIPVKTICNIIDVDYKSQDNWLKEHPFFAQLYRPSTTTGADGKQYSMSCLSVFDVDGWLHSLQMKGRKPGSVEKQYLFLAWLREQKLAMYKSIEEYISENAYELKLMEDKSKKLTEIETAQETLREAKKELATINTTIEEVRAGRFKGQYELAFPKQNDN